MLSGCPYVDVCRLSILQSLLGLVDKRKLYKQQLKRERERERERESAQGSAQSSPSGQGSGDHSDFHNGQMESKREGSAVIGKSGKENVWRKLAILNFITQKKVKMKQCTTARHIT